MATEQQIVAQGRMWRMDGKIASGDVAWFIRTQWWRVVAFTAIAAAIGGGLSFLRPRVWEATSVLQIGQVDESQSMVVEPPAQVVTRLKSDSFANGVMARVPLSGDKDQATLAELVRRTLRAEAFPGTDFVQITVRAFSPKDASAVLQETQNQLIAIHNGLETGAVERLHARLAELDQDIASATARHDRLDARLTSMAGSAQGGQKVVDALLNDMMSSTAREQLLKLEAERSDILMRLSPDHTYNTKPVGTIIVSHNPVAPKRTLYVVFGALVGLLAALLIGVHNGGAGAPRADAR
ncbi:hypothetical protein [Trinickia dinghuensis]|uniref:Polysaccharide chain length determinant N-terminal domain-containing protein n=1 Tax=Trinickia dinghuensis TaxID=2291023 RepID=A0A3D8JTE5_9BURK|nr:hypothetical protein [Trinickia dinghuensis]RDU96042.1 hypothetical protein DWV00_25680 [Trinickia dinghuensis]